MTWRIGEHGFEMRLATTIPGLLAPDCCVFANIGGLFELFPQPAGTSWSLRIPVPSRAFPVGTAASG